MISEWARFGRLSDEQVSALERHYELLKQWNERMNLTRMTSIEETIRFHYCESMFMGTVLPYGALSIADIGSGAGFPGIPLAIIRPECTVVLIESNQRKSVFLRESCRFVPNASVICSRAEDVSGSYDWVVSRAVGVEDVLRARLAPRTAVHMSGSDAARLPQVDRVIPMPWGDQRVIAMFQTFHVEHTNMEQTKPTC